MQALIVTMGETMMSLSGSADAPIAVGGAMAASFAGAESNVAIALARLGHRARFLSVVGDDPLGRAIVKGLRGEGVDISGVACSAEHPTGVMIKQRWPGPEPEVFYYRSTSAFAHASAGTFDPALWRDAGMIYLSGITPALSPSCRELVRRVLEDASARGIAVWFDPNYRARLWAAPTARAVLAPYLPLIDTLVGGVREGQMLTGRSDSDEIAAALLGAGVRRVVLRGAGWGMSVTAEGAVRGEWPRPQRIVDPVGAGDAFCAGYLSGHLDGLAAGACLERARAMAALVCMTCGDWEGLPSRRELEAFLGGSAEARR